MINWEGYTPYYSITIVKRPVKSIEIIHQLNPRLTEMPVREFQPF